MSVSGERSTKAFSCIRCFERKVKCDKSNPCSNCVRSKVECVFRIPPAPRRRKKKTQEEVLLARLKRCEELLRSKGVDIDSPEAPTQSSTSLTPHEGSATEQETTDHYPPFVISQTVNKSGQLLVDHGKTRFIENNLWTSVSEEFRQQPNEAIVEYSDDEDEVDSHVEETGDFLLGFHPSSHPIHPLHPSPEHIFALWQIFLDNINPLTKFIHQPSFQETLVNATSNLDNLPRGLEALLFAIYLAAVFSIGDDECEMKLGEPRKVLLARYQHATRKALARARFLGTSELVVLQAFVLYLLTMREDYDSRTTWTLTGVANRIGQGMGLHRDGTSLGVSPFETEMRRRLWWQISIMDFRSAELSGSGRFGEFGLSDTKVPSNVNDVDIWPEMTEPPVSQTRPTEMISCLLRCEFGSFWKERLLQKSSIVFENLRLSSPWATTLDERDAHIDELEKRIEEKFLRYCDPANPIQFLAIIIGRAAVNSMRLMAHHPRKYGKGHDIPQSERDYLWHIAVKLLESDNLAHSSQGLQRFMWHTTVYFQWQAFVYILTELRHKTLGDDVDSVWHQVDEIFRHHTNFVTDFKKPLHAAVGSLCLKAYSAREKALREATHGVFPKAAPGYIQLLREQREKGQFLRTSKAEEKARVTGAVHDSNGTTTWDAGVTGLGSIASPLSDSPTRVQLPLGSFPSGTMSDLPDDTIMFPSETLLAHDLAMADMPMDWAHWDNIMQDYGQIPR